MPSAARFRYLANLEKIARLKRFAIVLVGAGKESAEISDELDKLKNALGFIQLKPLKTCLQKGTNKEAIVCVVGETEMKTDYLQVFNHKEKIEAFDILKTQFELLQYVEGYVQEQVKLVIICWSDRMKGFLIKTKEVTCLGEAIFVNGQDKLNKDSVKKMLKIYNETMLKDAFIVYHDVNDWVLGILQGELGHFNPVQVDIDDDLCWESAVLSMQSHFAYSDLAVELCILEEFFRASTYSKSHELETVFQTRSGKKEEQSRIIVSEEASFNRVVYKCIQRDGTLIKYLEEGVAVAEEEDGHALESVKRFTDWLEDSDPRDVPWDVVVVTRRTNLGNKFMEHHEAAILFDVKTPAA